MLFRSGQADPPASGRQPAAAPNKPAPVAIRPAPGSSSIAVAPAARGDSPAQPLTAAEPTADQLRGLLERWLQAKSSVLGGATPPADLNQLARDGLLRQLEQQRAQDRARGVSQGIDVKVRSVAIEERSANRIALRADLDYSDITRDGSGREVDRTTPRTLRNVYVFGRDRDTWRLAATRSIR